MSKWIIGAFIIVILISLVFIFYTKKEDEIKSTKEKKDLQEETTENSTNVSKITLITVYDNYRVSPEFKTGWGFGCVIRIGEKNILFDTGADSPTLLSNMEKLNIDPSEIDLVILSHIHGDHIGGLKGFLEKNSQVKVFIPESFPISIKKEIQALGAQYQEISDSIQIDEHLYTTGEMGSWIKEQSLIINTKNGLVVITGCAHPGIVDIVKKAKEILNKEIYLVLGGFHLSGIGNRELKSIIGEFKELGVKKAAPCHCSGDLCRQLFKEKYQDDFIENGVGKIIEI